MDVHPTITGIDPYPYIQHMQLTMIMRIHWKTPSRVVSQEMAGMADYERLVRERKEPRQQ
jgi:hypothetical protein